MKLLEKGILLIGALVIVVTGVVLNNYLISKNSNDFNDYEIYSDISLISGGPEGGKAEGGVLINTKTGDAWMLVQDNDTAKPFKIKYKDYEFPSSD